MSTLPWMVLHVSPAEKVGRLGMGLANLPCNVPTETPMISQKPPQVLGKEEVSS